MQFEFEGKQWEFSHYGHPIHTDVFINYEGRVITDVVDFTRNNATRLILKPLEIHHTLGGVVWKEGAKRLMHPSEISWNPTGGLYYWNTPSASEHILLTPIALA